MFKYCCWYWIKNVCTLLYICTFSVTKFTIFNFSYYSDRCFHEFSNLHSALMLFHSPVIQMYNFSIIPQPSYCVKFILSTHCVISDSVLITRAFTLFFLNKNSTVLIISLTHWTHSFKWTFYFPNKMQDVNLLLNSVWNM